MPNSIVNNIIPQPFSMKDKILHGFLKQSADKIIQILDKVREERDKNSRRWIWELIQNAKDVTNKYERVSIYIELDKDQFLFKHNGDPFSESNLINLIQQVSSKKMLNEDPLDIKNEGITGVFGTGFISTHLLSKIIRIDGCLKRDAGTIQRFKLKLDRNAENSAQLIPLIDRAITKLLNLDTDEDFVKDLNYSEERSEENFDTIFTYPLNDENSKKAATIGIKELINTLPTTMVFLHKIKKVTIKRGVEIIYIESECIESTAVHAYFKVKRNEEELNFIVWKNSPRLMLLLQVNNFKDLEIMIPKWNQPILYKDFPLVGTEKFYFPFYLNGLDFFTTEQRDGILIKGLDQKQIHNREILKLAQKEGINFSNWLILHNAKNLFVLANTQIPSDITNYSDVSEDTKNWFKEYQTQWRKKISDLTLVETQSGKLKKIVECRFPRSNYNGSKENNEHFYDLVSDFIGNENLPKKTIYIEWLKSLGPKNECETWDNSNLIYDENSLVYGIKLFNNLNELVLGNKLNTNKDEKTNWLNRFYNYLSQHNKLDILNNNPIIPNQLNTFETLNNLYWESNLQPIPEIILDVTAKLNNNWRKFLIHRKINFEGILKREKGLSEASTEINDKLANERKNARGIVESDFLDTRDCEFVLINILKLTSQNGDKKSFKYNLFIYAKDILHFEEDFLIVSNLVGFSFDKASRLMVRYINQKISNTKTLENLSIQLNKKASCTISWLNSYLIYIQGSFEYKYLLNNVNIIPNREGTLCAFEELKNYGTSETPLDDILLEILNQFDSSQNRYSYLIAQGLTFRVIKTYEFNELVESIKIFIRNISNMDYEPYRDSLLNLINWYKKSENEEVKNIYFSDFDAELCTILFRLTINNSEFSDDIFNILKEPEKIAGLIETSKMIEDNGLNANELKEIAQSPFFKQLSELTKSPKIKGNVNDVLILLKQTNIGANLSRLAKVREKDFEKALSIIEVEKGKNDTMDFQRRIGKKVEDLFKKTLEQQNIDYTIHYQGTGSNDFVIKNTKGGEPFFVELKSYSHEHKDNPIKLSTSQASLAAKREKNYAVCIIQNPINPNDLTENYMTEKLMYLKNLSGAFKDSLNQYSNIIEIQKTNKQISLKLENSTCFVKVNQDFIHTNKLSFKNLVEDMLQFLR